MSKKLILFPLGGNAREAFDLIRSDQLLKKQWDIIGFLDDGHAHLGKEYGDVKVLGGKEILKKYPQAMVLAVPGNPHNYMNRDELISSFNISKSRFATVIHSSVVVSSNAKIGFNTLVMPHVVIGSDVSIGNHCVILANTTISHDTVIEDFCCVGANVALAGGVWLKNNCYIGSGTSVRDQMTIGKRSLIGLGSTVVKDVEQDVVVAGNPARVLRKLE